MSTLNEMVVQLATMGQQRRILMLQKYHSKKSTESYCDYYYHQ